MAKVQFKYRVDFWDRYKNKTLYRQKTIEMELPKDRYGFILDCELGKKIISYLKNEAGIVGKVKHPTFTHLTATGIELLYHRIIEGSGTHGTNIATT